MEASFNNSTSTFISRHSRRTEGSVFGSCRNLERTARVSVSREWEANHLGEYGNRVVPIAKRNAGISCRNSGSRKDNSESIVRVP